MALKTHESGLIFLKCLVGRRSFHTAVKSRNYLKELSSHLRTRLSTRSSCWLVWARQSTDCRAGPLPSAKASQLKVSKSKHRHGLSEENLSSSSVTQNSVSVVVLAQLVSVLVLRRCCWHQRLCVGQPSWCFSCLFLFYWIVQLSCHKELGRVVLKAAVCLLSSSIAHSHPISQPRDEEK